MRMAHRAILTIGVVLTRGIGEASGSGAGHESPHDVMVVDDSQQMVLDIHDREHPEMVLGKQLCQIVTHVVLLGGDYRRHHQVAQRRVIRRQDEVAQVHDTDELLVFTVDDIDV